MTEEKSEQYLRAERLTRDLPDLMTTTEVCEFFRIGKQKLKEWREGGDLPGMMKIGRDWRIPKDDIIDLAIKLYGQD